jgi:aspartate aminotransferase-like enzyme
MPVEEIGAGKGSQYFVVNASQSAGVFPIDVKRMGIDALCATGHKWMLAGYGSGFVYLSREILDATRPRAVSWMSVEDPFAMRNDSYELRRDAAARSETGCPHFAGIFALGEAARQLLELGVEQVERRALALNRRMTERLTEAGWKVLSPLADERARSAETLVAPLTRALPSNTSRAAASPSPSSPKASAPPRTSSTTTPTSNASSTHSKKCAIVQCEVDLTRARRLSIFLASHAGVTQW